MAFDLANSSLFRQQAFFADQWRDAGDDATFEVTNPATGEVIGSCPSLAEADVEQAVSAAEKACRIWSVETAAHRTAVLNRRHALILENRERLARSITTERGKPIAEARRAGGIKGVALAEKDPSTEAMSAWIPNTAAWSVLPGKPGQTASVPAFKEAR